MITNTEKTLKEMNLLYQWSQNTYNLYQTALNSYTTYHQKTLPELIHEAETDETTTPKPKQRKIYQRLIQYRIHLQEHYTPNTTKNYLSKIIRIYKYHDILVPEMPPIKNNIVETYEDLPTNKEITQAILHSRTKMKALITFIASSGLRRSDVAQLTIQDFLNATRQYNNHASNVPELIQSLQHEEIIVPTWNIISQKTHINHITFNSTESSKYILQMLQERLLKKDINNNDLLFDITSQTITKNFKQINTRLDMGWKHTRRRFHPHALRKYFATVLTSHDVPYLDVHFMMGHSLGNVDSSYYFCNPERLRNKYVHVMDYLTFTMKVSYIDISEGSRKELEDLKRYRSDSDRRISQLEDMLDLLCKEL